VPCEAVANVKSGLSFLKPASVHDGFEFAFLVPEIADVLKIPRHATDTPVLSFILKFHQDHFSFVAVLSVNGNALKFEYKPHFFVFDENTDLCYLMASV
jgi:hypothetical protein